MQCLGRLPKQVLQCTHMIAMGMAALSRLRSEIEPSSGSSIMWCDACFPLSGSGVHLLQVYCMLPLQL